METRTYQLSGLNCGHCAASVEKSIGLLKGILSAKVNLASQTVEIGMETGQAGEAEIRNAVSSAGFSLIGPA